MRWIITEPDGAETALDDPRSRFRAEPGPSCAPVIVEDRRLSRRERLGIYAEAYYLRLYKSLEEDYLAVQRCLGEERFRDLISDYLLDHPSRSFDLIVLGRALPDYLGEWMEKDDPAFLPDLARLEWALVFAGVAPDLACWEPVLMAQVEPERLRLKCAPAVALFETSFAIEEIRTALRGPEWGGVVAELISQVRPIEVLKQHRIRHLVVHRRALLPACEEVSLPEFRLLEAAKECETLARACERLEEFDSVTSEALGAWISKWAACGSLACDILSSR